MGKSSSSPASLPSSPLASFSFFNSNIAFCTRSFSSFSFLSCSSSLFFSISFFRSSSFFFHALKELSDCSSSSSLSLLREEARLLASDTFPLFFSFPLFFLGFARDLAAPDVFGVCFFALAFTAAPLDARLFLAGGLVAVSPSTSSSSSSSIISLFFRFRPPVFFSRWFSSCVAINLFLLLFFNHFTFLSLSTTCFFWL